MALTWSHLFLTLTLAFILTSVPTQGQNRDTLPTVWSVFSYPNPYSVIREQQWMCGRYNQSYVCDPNAILSTTQADHIDVEIKRAMATTPCHCLQCSNRQSDRGYKFRVAIMREMARVRNYTRGDRIAQLRDAQLYSYILSQRWSMQGLCNETVLILYSRADNLVYTLTMPAAKLRLSNNDVTRIIMITRPYFETRETIADGIIQMIKRYSLIFNDRYDLAFNQGAIE